MPKLTKTALKKTALTLLTFGIISTACAADYPIPPDLPSEGPVFYEPATIKHGVYIGLGVGALDFNNTMDYSASGVAANTPFNISQSTSNNNVGVTGVLDLGYYWAFPNRLFFGVEGFGNLNNAKVSQSASNSKTTANGDITANLSISDDFKWEGVYGARVLPGIQVTSHSTLYGIVGYARGAASLSTPTNSSTVTDNNTGTVTTINLNENSGLFTNYSFNGYQLGLGTMIDLVPHLALRADVIYSGYSSQTLGTKTTTFSDGGTATTSLSAQPYTVEGDLSLVYMFG